MSLRHLFSSNYASQVLKLEYWGPVLDNNSNITPSPDCLIVDKRSEPYRLRRCEFKYQPSNIKEFEHNGNFDLAIIWDLSQGLARDKIKHQLREQNKCEELIILSDYPQFKKLPDYSISDQLISHSVQNMVSFLLEREPHVIFSAYLICGAFPKFIHSGKLVEILVDNFESIRRMSDQGKANATYSLFLQAKPRPIIEKKYGIVYCWNNYYQPKISLNRITELMNTNFNMTTPSKDLVNRIIVG